MGYKMCALGETLLFLLQVLSANGDAMVAEINWKGVPDEQTMHVTCQDLISKYQVVNTSMPKNANYLDDHASASSKWTMTMLTSRIHLAMDAVTRRHGVQHVLCRESPQKMAFTTQAVPNVNDLALVATSQNIKVVELKKKTEVVHAFQCRGIDLMAHCKAFIATPTNDFVVPAFFVDSTDDESKATMKVILLEPDAFKRDRSGKSPDGINGGPIQVPVLTNSKRLEVGERLFYSDKFKAKKATGAVKRPFDLL